MKERGVVLRQRRADELAERNYKILDRSYTDLERLADADEQWKDVSVRTKVALAVVTMHRGEVRAEREMGAGITTLNVVQVVNRIENHADWEAQAAAVEAGRVIVSDVIDVHSIEAQDGSDEWADEDAD